MNKPTVMNDRSALIVLRDVSKIYRKGQESIRALDGIDLTVAEQGMVAVVGPSEIGRAHV